MTDEHELKMSPLSREITRDGVTVYIDIYEDGDGGWTLEVVDEYSNSTVWNDPFDTDEDALREALDSIEREGIISFIGPEMGVLH
jgi:hypothetical protein